MTDRLDPNQNGACSDGELLRRFHTKKSEEAFRRLVERYLGMVFGVALRRCGNRQLAEEAAQNVFTVLAQKAVSLQSHEVLGGWLQRAALLETLRMMRNESRRQRAMENYINTQGADSSQETANPALETLDEAIAGLPAADRNILILRFHGGLRLRQIAERLGTTEEACRKRVDRALRKLSGSFARKGMAISVTALAAGITSALGSAAPSGLAALVTEKALSVSAAATSSSIAFWISIMTQTKAKLIVTGAICFGLSFLSGRNQARQFEAAANQPLPGAVAMPASRDWNARPAGTHSLETRDLLEKTAQILRQGGGWSGSHYKARLLLQKLHPREMPEALAFLESVKTEPKVLSSMARILTGIWAETDGPAAAAWADENLTPESGLLAAYTDILASWSRRFPREAYHWYGQKAESGHGISPNSFRWLPQHIFRAWAARDPWGAVFALDTVPLEDQRAASSGISMALAASEDPNWLLSAVHSMPRSETKSRLVESVAKRWAKESPESSAAWVDSVDLPDRMSRFRVKAEVAEEWIRHDRGAFVQVGAWLLSGAPHEMRREIVEALRSEARRIEVESQTE